jgi:hypothetical protein
MQRLSSPQERLQSVIAGIKTGLMREAGRYTTSEASEALFEQLKRTNALDQVGIVVMRLGCQRAIIARPGGRVDRDSMIPSPLQMDFCEYEAGFEVDDEIAISGGRDAVRKPRRACNLIELKASIALRLAHADAARVSAMKDQALIDLHPEWELNPTWTVGWIIGVDSEPA